LYTASTGVLNIQGGATGTLAGGTYCFNHITIGGGSILSVSSPVNIFVIAASDLSGGSVANTSLNASSLKLFSSLNAPSNNNGFKLSGGTQSYMSIYAPDTGITFSGGTTDLLRGRRRLQHHGYRRHAVSLRSVAGERVGSHAAAALELARGSELSLDPTV